MDVAHLLYHLMVATVYAYAVYYNWFYTYVKGADEVIGGKLKYLTFWNLCLQTIYFTLCLINDVTGTNLSPKYGPDSRSKLQKWRDNIFASLAVPVGVFVVVTFWSLYFVNRDLVFPEFLDKIIPSWLNHIMHTTVILFLLVEGYISYHRFPRRKNGLSALIAFSSLYLVWILWIAYYAEYWVYPFFEVLSSGERIIFILFLLVLYISIYLLGEAWNNFLWRKEIWNSKKKPS